MVGIRVRYIGRSEWSNGQWLSVLCYRMVARGSDTKWLCSSTDSCKLILSFSPFYIWQSDLGCHTPKKKKKGQFHFENTPKCVALNSSTIQLWWSDRHCTACLFLKRSTVSMIPSAGERTSSGLTLLRILDGYIVSNIQDFWSIDLILMSPSFSM